METVLVTGATGFIGSQLARRLVSDGNEVHILCRESSNFWRLKDVLAKISCHQVDIADAARLRSIIQSIRPTRIFHLASATMVAGSSAPPDELVRVNLQGSINLIDACNDVGYEGLVCTGDSFEYTPSTDPLREDNDCRPESLHGITKLAATLYSAATARKGKPIVTLRLFSTYGRGDNPARLVPRVIAGALAGTPISLSRPQMARDWIFIDDVVSIYVEAAQRAKHLAGGVFNVGSGKKSDLADIVSLILKLSKSNAELRWGAFNSPDHDAFPWTADMAKTFEKFKWRPQISLEEGLSLTIHDLVTNGVKI